MAYLRTNRPPEYDQRASVKDNFQRFFEWSLELRDPLKQIPEIGAGLGFAPPRVHPIGFTAVYLSPPNEGLNTAGNFGVVRADVCPPGVVLEPDVHCHGFDFISGVAKGILVNRVHHMDWSKQAPDGEGYTGYESSVDTLGRNRIVRATRATVVVPDPEVQELSEGETYTLQPRVDFHSVEAHYGTVTIFGKTPTYVGQQGLALVLRPPGHSAPPPEVY